MKVVGIAGSVRKDSYTAAAVRVALGGAAEMGVEVELLDLRDFDLPFAETHQPDGAVSPNVLRLREKLRGADAIVLGTPEYHGGMSGVLKNALDLCDSTEFSGKAVGLVAVSGGALGGWESMSQLRTVLRALHAWVLPEQAAIASAWKVFDQTGLLRDEALEKRLRNVGRNVVRTAAILVAAGNEKAA